MLYITNGGKISRLEESFKTCQRGASQCFRTKLSDTHNLAGGHCTTPIPVDAVSRVLPSERNTGRRAPGRRGSGGRRHPKHAYFGPGQLSVSDEAAIVR